MGGLWVDLATSTRPIAEILRTLARGDPSVALVSSMHPAVLSFWLCQPEAPEPYTRAWSGQLRFVAQTAVDGHFWGTITSEPGSGGDVAKTKAAARRGDGGGHLMSGVKHFGSGSGVTSYMITTALPEGDDSADWFFLDVRDAKWDGSSGLKLTAEWDGHGMAATQSHGFEFASYPATRMAWPGNLTVVSGKAGAFVSALFTAVITGVAESAVELAREQIARKRDSLRAYEQVEWARVENEVWLIHQAYEGMLAASTRRARALCWTRCTPRRLSPSFAESVTGRICPIIGGAASGVPRRSASSSKTCAPWLPAPPWGLAFDQILQRTWAEQ
jgi:alkylation response protein AidB-like acyl-CoA dehydrogenase